MTGTFYQVRTPAGLSRPYSVGNLRRKRDHGYVENSAACTHDGGETWTTIELLLAQYASHREGRSDDRQAADASAIQPQDSVLAEMRRRESDESSADSAASSVTMQRPGRSQIARSPVEDTDYMSGPQAASAALHAASQRRADKRKADQEGAVSDKVAPRDASVRSQLLSAVLGGSIAAILTTAMVLFRERQALKQNVDSFTALVQQELGRSPDGSISVMSVEELSARSRLMAAQLNRMAEELALEGLQIPANSITAADKKNRSGLLPYRQSSDITADEAELKLLSHQYTDLVRSKGADGREMNIETVELFSRRIARMMALVGIAPNRTTAVSNLAERTKILYLLQLHNTSSQDNSRHNTGRKILLTSSNAGLAKLYPDFAIGDVRFSDLLDLTEPEERAALALVRYWYHRSASRAAADEWLRLAIRDLPKEVIGSTERSIQEADNIEHR